MGCDPVVAAALVDALFEPETNPAGADHQRVGADTETPGQLFALFDPLPPLTLVVVHDQHALGIGQGGEATVKT